MIIVIQNNKEDIFPTAKRTMLATAKQITIIARSFIMFILSFELVFILVPVFRSSELHCPALP